LKSLIQERVLWPVWLFASDLSSGSRALSCKRLIHKRIPGRSKRTIFVNGWSQPRNLKEHRVRVMLDALVIKGTRKCQSQSPALHASIFPDAKQLIPNHHPIVSKGTPRSNEEFPDDLVIRPFGLWTEAILLVRLLLYWYRARLILKLEGRPVDDKNRRVSPDMWKEYRATYKFQGPLCLCPLLRTINEDPPFTEAEIVLKVSGDYVGEYIAECPNKRCEYFGQFPIAFQVMNC
jgi:hypothetical protein